MIGFILSTFTVYFVFKRIFFFSSLFRYCVIGILSIFDFDVLTLFAFLTGTWLSVQYSLFRNRPSSPSPLISRLYVRDAKTHCKKARRWLAVTIKPSSGVSVGSQFQSNSLVPSGTVYLTSRFRYLSATNYTVNSVFNECYSKPHHYSSFSGKN